MKKIICCVGFMMFAVVLLPMLIVKGCYRPAEGKPPDEGKPPAEITDAGKYLISVYNHKLDKTEIMELEEYIKGVLAAEMPADFALEALKAQAVAARTFAYGRMSGAYKSKAGVHDEADICTDFSHCQAWVSKIDAMKNWGVFFASRNWRIIEKAVESTSGMIVVFEGNVANTVFHASSFERTENAEDVWIGNGAPYLKSVESPGEEYAKGYVTSVLVKTEELAAKIIKTYPEAELGDNILEDIKIIDYTAGGRVKTVEAGKVTLKGTEFRTLLGLRSANFLLEAAGDEDDGMVKITTKGFGHGVGMSQWGADALARTGGTYMEILKHYYTGVDVIPIIEYEDSNNVR